jgi:hypothetical protein
MEGVIMFNVFMFGLSSADFVAFVSHLTPTLQKWVVRAYLFGCGISIIGGLF